jgi:hypothetical protein
LTGAGGGRKIPGVLAVLHPLAANALAFGVRRGAAWIGVALLAIWFLLALMLRIIRRPSRAATGTPTMDLGPESPAVANLLVNDFRLTPDALPATLLDLAARRFMDIEEPEPGTYVCRPKPRNEAELTSYEGLVLELVQGRAVDGVVPAQALTTGPQEQAKRWWKVFRDGVVSECHARGITQDLWDRRTIGTLGAAAVAPAPFFGVAIPFWGAVYYAIGMVVVIGLIVAGGRQRDRPAGLEAASRWLGVRAKLHEDPSFQTAPPTAVAIWDRYLAYGAALGVAAGVVRAVPMGAEDDHRAWSSMGGTWRQVRVSYPWWTPGWGMLPLREAAVGLGGIVVAGGIALIARAVANNSPSANADRILFIGFVLMALVAVWAVPLLIRSVADMFATYHVTGPVLRARRRGTDKRPMFYMAVDDGKSPRIRALRVDGPTYAQAAEGEWVTVTCTRNLRYVSALEQAAPPQQASQGGGRGAAASGVLPDATQGLGGSGGP